MPSVPPSSQPVVSTVSSMAVRTSRIDHPVRACSPVINPSRGPGPSRTPMYAADARPFSTTPATMNTIRGASADGGATTASVRSTATAITRMFDTVPMPGRCRSGIQHSSTSAPVNAVTVPNVSPVSSDSASCSTSHGSRPRPDLIIRPMLAPYRASPPNSWARRRTGDVRTGT